MGAADDRATMAQPLVPLTNRPATDLAGVLRSWIVGAQFAPGQRLVEAELASLFGATRTEVRTAMAVLHREGLVELNRGRSARVHQLSLAQALELAELRQAIWTLVSRRAAERCTSVSEASLHAGISSAREAIEATDLVALGRGILELDARVAAISGHRPAQEELRRLDLRLARHDFQGIAVAGRARTALAEVEQLVTAVAAGDRDRAAEAADLHFANTVEAIKNGHAARREADTKTVRTV